jgi:NAD(P)-dependent dehydrogenase (short-subunit alcohol dehydrogenase family)
VREEGVKRVLITGASRGIGRAVAERLAAPGRTLLLHGRDNRGLAETARRVRGRGAASAELTFDLRAREEVLALAAAAGSEPLTGLVNNAGVTVVKPFAAVTASEWEDSLAVNVTAPFLLCRALAPAMPRGAAIVNVLSIAARRGFPGWSAYCASKFALEGLTRCLREELRGDGVRVVGIYPSATDTPLWEGVAGEWPRDKMLPPEEVADAVVYALTRPAEVMVDEVSLGHQAGEL